MQRGANDFLGTIGENVARNLPYIEHARRFAETMRQRLSLDADSLVIEASVDANGRVQDYRILSDPPDEKEVLPQVKRMLIFTTFRPALSMGRPTPSKAVLSFSKISVKG